MKSLEKTLYEMFTENTGSHMLDSGGAYGRHHEKNAKKTIEDFNNEPSVTPEFHDGALEYWTISTWHYLKNANLELDKICERFNRINLKADDCDYEGSYMVAQKAGEYLESLEADFEDPWNTYNGDSGLSQVLQGQYLTIGADRYVLISLHQGCDVRGGYTVARLFKFNDYEDYLPSEDVSGEVTLENGETITIDLRIGELPMDINCNYLDANVKFTDAKLYLVGE